MFDMVEDMLKRLVDAACAVYRVSCRLPADDPLPRMLKEAALVAIASCAVFFCAPEEYNKKKAHSDIRTLCSYFFVAKKQGWIDARNFDVLISEYQSIQAILTSSLGSPGLPSETGQKVLRNIRKNDSTQLSQRQQKIFAYMKNRIGGQISLKDLRELFPDIASRTIQRDVQALLEMGLIGKRGTTHNTTYHSSQGLSGNPSNS